MKGDIFVTFTLLSRKKIEKSYVCLEINRQLTYLNEEKKTSVKYSKLNI
jgi:hypothetical protein